MKIKEFSFLPEQVLATANPSVVCNVRAPYSAG